MEGETFGEVKQQGFRRGSYEWLVKDLDSLKRYKMIESSMFEFGKFNWKLGLYRGFRNSCPPEMIRVFVFSCNAEAVITDIKFSVDTGVSGRGYHVERRTKTACSFHDIDRHDIPLIQLMDAAGRISTLAVRVDFKNVNAATDRELRDSEHNRRRVLLEVIGNETFKERLDQGAVFGLIPPILKPDSHVYDCTLVRLWAEQCSDHRYWLCTRVADASMLLERYLNSAELLESFGDICNEESGCPVVTLFREDRKSRKPFQEISRNTLVVFCKVYEAAEYSDLTYTGHLLVEKTMKCYELLRTIADDLLSLPDRTEYDAYLEIGDDSIKDITTEQNTLAECGIRSGSCIIIAMRKSTQRTTVDVVQETLRQIHYREARSVKSRGSPNKDSTDTPCMSVVHIDVIKHTEGEPLLPTIYGDQTPKNEQSCRGFVIIPVVPLSGSQHDSRYPVGISSAQKLGAIFASTFLSSQRRRIEQVRSRLRQFGCLLLSQNRSCWRQFRRLLSRTILAMPFISRTTHDEHGPLGVHRDRTTLAQV